MYCKVGWKKLNLLELKCVYIGFILRILLVFVLVFEFVDCELFW